MASENSKEIELEQERVRLRASSARPLQIFMSYRRADTRGYAGWLYHSLAPIFGSENLFRDVAALQAGVDFMMEIDRSISRSDVVLCLIGPRWLEVAAEGRRLDNPDDPVRTEIRTSLEKRKPVIPVLVEGIPMPKPEDLPADLKALCSLTGLWMDDAGWDNDLAELVKHINASRPNEKLAGAEIVERALTNQSCPNWIGRAGGRRGAALREDVSSRRWQEQTYEVSYKLAIPNLQNWMPVSDFVGEVNQESSGAHDLP